MKPPDEPLTNESWLLHQIRNADSNNRLDDISLIIAYDKWEDLEYTKDPDVMELLRREWGRRRDEIRKKRP